MHEDEANFVQLEGQQTSTVEDNIGQVGDPSNRLSAAGLLCSRCSNHGKSVQVRGHKRYCEHRFCLCAGCKLLGCRQQVSAIKLRQRLEKMRTKESHDQVAEHSTLQSEMDHAEQNIETITASSNAEGTPEAGESSCIVSVKHLSAQAAAMQSDDVSTGATGRATQVHQVTSDATQTDRPTKSHMLILKLVIFSWYLTEGCLVRYRWSAMNVLALTEAKLSSALFLGRICKLTLVPLLCFLIDKTGCHRLALFLSMLIYSLSFILMQIMAHNPEFYSLLFPHRLPPSLFAFIVAFQRVGVGLSSVLLDTSILVQTERCNASFGVQKLWVVLALSLVSPIFDFYYQPGMKEEDASSVDVAVYLLNTLAVVAALLSLGLSFKVSPALHRQRIRPSWIDRCLFVSTVFLTGVCETLTDFFLINSLNSRPNEHYLDNMITISGALVSLPVMCCSDWILRKVGLLRSILICLLLHLTLLVLLAADRDEELAILTGAAADVVTNFMWIAVAKFTYQTSPPTLIASSQALVTLLVFGFGQNSGKIEVLIAFVRDDELFKLSCRVTLGIALVVFMLYNSFASYRSARSRASASEGQHQLLRWDASDGEQSSEFIGRLQVSATQFGLAQLSKATFTTLRVCLFCWFVVAIFLSSYMLKHMQLYVQMMVGSWNFYSLTGMCLIELLSIPLVCFLAKQAGRSRLTLLLGLVSCVAVTFLVQSLAHLPVTKEGAGWSDSTHLLLFLLTMVLYQVATVLITLALDAMSGLLQQHDSRQPVKSKLRLYLVEVFYPTSAILLVSCIEHMDKFVLLYLYAIFATVTIHTWNSLSLEISSSNVWAATSGPQLKTTTIWLYVFAVFIMGSCAGFLATYFPDVLKLIRAPENVLESARTVATSIGLPFLYSIQQPILPFSTMKVFYYLAGWYVTSVLLDIFITKRYWWLYMIFVMAEAFVLSYMWTASLQLSNQIGAADRRENLRALARLLYYGLGLNFGAFFGGFIVKSHGIELSFVGLALVGLVAASLYLLLYCRFARRNREGGPGDTAPPVHLGT